MARPETAEDLPGHETAAREFVTVNLDHLTVDISVGVALLGLIEAARNSETFVVDDDGRFVVSLPLTEEEIRRRLASAQKSWDQAEDEYRRAAFGELAPSYRRWAIDSWSDAEGKERIDWERLEDQSPL